MKNFKWGIAVITSLYFLNMFNLSYAESLTDDKKTGTKTESAKPTSLQGPHEP